MEILRLDVGKRELHAILLQGDRSASKSVPNSSAGVKQLQTWLKNRKVERVHACLEATGGWSEEVALALCEAGHLVSLVNPARIKAFAQSEMLRTKTDRIDAALIARFCRMHEPEPWTPLRWKSASCKDSFVATRAWSRCGRAEPPPSTARRAGGQGVDRGDAGPSGSRNRTGRS